jgi:hypothetical protein
MQDTLHVFQLRMEGVLISSVPNSPGDHSPVFKNLARGCGCQSDGELEEVYVFSIRHFLGLSPHLSPNISSMRVLVLYILNM